MSKNGDKYVKYSLFFATVALILGLIAIVYNNGKDIPADVAVIKTDINYIKEDIVEIKETLTANVGMQVPEDIDFADKVFADEPTVYEPSYKPPLAQIVASKELTELSICIEDEICVQKLEELGIATTTQAP